MTSTYVCQAAHMRCPYWCLMLTIMAGGLGRIASFTRHD